MAVNDDKPNPLALDEDFYIEAKPPPSGSLSDNKEDVEYFLKNLYRALRIPESFRGYKPT